MPRLLPRILKWLERNPPSQPHYRGPLIQRRRQRPHSLWKATPSPDEYLKQFSLKNRRQSLVLDHDSLLVSPHGHERHKTLPPVVKIHDNQIDLTRGQDALREMTEQEKQWWSNPYLRMLSSPIRFCHLTYRHLPCEFLIRLTALRTSLSKAVLVPNGILHPRFATRYHGAVFYVTCWKEAVQRLARKDRPKKTVNAGAHPLLEGQITHQLRQRVLQELEMLALRLKAAPLSDSNEAVIRRLTRSEWITMRERGQVPLEGAACVLIVPPVNKDPRTKQRPQPNYGDVPIDDLHTNTAPPDKDLPPLLILHKTRETDYDEPLRLLKNTHLPHDRVPVYNSLSLFPSRHQRAALHRRLCELLAVERHVNWKRKQRSENETRSIYENPSHAFIVFSNARTVSRADTVPLAIALWRIKMWEGEGWGDSEWSLRE